MCCQGTGVPLRGGVVASVCEGLDSVPSTTARSGSAAQKEGPAGSRPDAIAHNLWTLQPPGQLTGGGTIVPFIQMVKLR